jgi:hypothetical protein
MRLATRSLSEKINRPVTDPPELLARLGQFYATSGRSADADNLKRDVQVEFRRAGKIEAGDNVVRAINLRNVRPVVPDTVVKPSRRITPEVRRAPDPAAATPTAVLQPRPAAAKPAEARPPEPAAAIQVVPSQTKVDPQTVARPAETSTVTKATAVISYRFVEVRVVDAASGQPARSATVIPVIDGVAGTALEGNAHRVRISLRARAASMRVRAPGYAAAEQAVGPGDTLVVRLRRAP